MVKIPYTPTPPTSLETPAVSDIHIRPSADGQSYVDGISVAEKTDNGGPEAAPLNNNQRDQAVVESEEMQQKDRRESKGDAGSEQDDNQNASTHSPVFLTETEDPEKEEVNPSPKNPNVDPRGQSAADNTESSGVPTTPADDNERSGDHKAPADDNERSDDHETTGDHKKSGKSENNDGEPSSLDW